MSNSKNIKVRSSIFEPGSEFQLNNLTILLGNNMTGKTTVIKELKKYESFKILHAKRSHYYELTSDSKKDIKELFGLNNEKDILSYSTSTGLDSAIPIIVELSNSSRNKVAIEHPELGLSEYNQHILINYILNRLDNKNTILIETHSLTVLNAISIALTEEDEKLSKDRVALNLFYKKNKNSKSSIDIIPIHKGGNLKANINNNYFPFDHSFNDAIKLALV